MDLLGQLLGFAPGADTHGTDAPHDDEFRAGAAQEPPQESNPRRWALQNRAVYNLTNDVSSLTSFAMRAHLTLDKSYRKLKTPAGTASPGFLPSHSPG
jgi:hypothetical protein